VDQNEQVKAKRNANRNQGDCCGAGHIPFNKPVPDRRKKSEQRQPHCDRSRDDQGEHDQLE